MIGTGILLVFLVTATVTDVRFRKIFNSTTYPGILTAFAVSAIATLAGVDDLNGTEAQRAVWGIVPIADSLVGFFACGITILICYVFFPGGVGGGDVKLIAMMGAFLGLYAGLEALMWTFVLGGCQALITLIWRVGAIRLLSKAAVQLWFVARSGAYAAIEADAKKTASVNMFLSPSALAAVVIVRFHLLEWLRF